MTDSIADRTYLAAVQQWEGNDSRGPKPQRANFAHLELSPDVPPQPQPAAAPLEGGVVVPVPMDVGTRAAVDDVLEQMYRSNRVSQPKGT